MIVTLEDAIEHGRGTERAFCCPVHDDHNASASVNVVKGWWYCFACGAKGTVDKRSSPAGKEALRLLERDLEPPRILVESALLVFDADHPSPYWSQRYGEVTARKFRCGTHPLTGFPTYPIRDATGQLLGVVQRDADGKPKYKYPYGVMSSRTVFLNNRLNHYPVVVLVEGAGDVMALDSEGVPNSWLIVGTYGAGVHRPQIEVIEDVGPAVIIGGFDHDKAGLLAMERAEHDLSGIAPVLSDPWGMVGSNDPGDLPLGERVPVLNQLLIDNGYQKYAREAA